jgi:hypothetical protein
MPRPRSAVVSGAVAGLALVGQFAGAGAMRADCQEALEVVLQLGALAQE